MSKYYPPLNEEDIRLVLQLMQSDPEYLTDRSCPYSADIINVFTAQNPNNYFDDPDKPKLNSTTDEDIAIQVNVLYNRLEAYWAEVQGSDKSTDKNTFFRVAASLLEKMVELRERMSTLKNVNTFTSEVLTIMDEILTPDQRGEVVARLQKYDTDSIVKQEISN